MGGIAYRIAFFPVYPGDPLVQSMVNKVSIDSASYKKRDIDELVSACQLDTIEWPQRRGTLTVMLQGLKYNHMALKYTCKPLIAQLEIRDNKTVNNILLDDLKQLIMHKQQSYTMPFSFCTLNLKGSIKLCLYSESISNSSRVATFTLNLEGVIKKHGEWGLGETYKAYDSELDGTNHPVVKAHAIFRYSNYEYAGVVSAPAAIDTSVIPSS